MCCSGWKTLLLTRSLVSVAVFLGYDVLLLKIYRVAKTLPVSVAVFLGYDVLRQPPFSFRKKTTSLFQYEMSLKPGNVAEVDSNIK